MSKKDKVKINGWVCPKCDTTNPKASKVCSECGNHNSIVMGFMDEYNFDESSD